MDKNTIKKLTGSFDGIVQHIPDGATEFWYARDLMDKLGYTKWQNFVEVVSKAKIACGNSNVPVENHFTDVSKMVRIGSGAERPIEDIMLTRYACYLIAQNGDPRKEEFRKNLSRVSRLVNHSAFSTHHPELGETALLKEIQP